MLLRSTFVRILLGLCLPLLGMKATWAHGPFNDQTASLATESTWVFSGGTARSVRDQGVMQIGSALLPRYMPHKRSVIQRMNAPTGVSENSRIQILTAKFPQPADLFVIVPGMFQGILDPQARKTFNELSHFGHVMIFPNGLSKEYESQLPEAMIGSFREEATHLLGVIASLQNYWGQDVRKIHVIGASQGAFISAVLIGIDQGNLITGNTILLNPPLSESTTMQSWDHLVGQIPSGSWSEKLVGGSALNTRIIPFLLRALKKYVQARDQGKLQQLYTQAELKQFGLIPGIEELTLAQIETYKQEKRQPQWIRQMTFGKLTQYMRPSLKELFDSEQNFLRYHLQAAHQHGNDRWGIFTTRDDFTNLQNEWRDEKTFPRHMLNPSNFIEMPEGGHIWYIGMDTRPLWRNLFMPSVNP
jgi:hypothetical protein